MQDGLISIITIIMGFDLQVMSNLTEVEMGTEMLLLVAWQVKMVCKSLRCKSLISISLMTFWPSITWYELSSRAWSFHHVTLR